MVYTKHGMDEPTTWLHELTTDTHALTRKEGDVEDWDAISANCNRSV